MKSTTPTHWALVQNNLIGADATGTIPLGNRTDDIFIGQGEIYNTIGGTAAGTGNVIVVAIDDGIHISGSGTSSNLVEGNWIGLNRSGTASYKGASFGNGLDGVAIDTQASNNTIGGTLPGRATSSPATSMAWRSTTPASTSSRGT